MSAIADVARLAGVSKSTASRALSGRGYVSPATRERVVDAAAEIGYVVSSNAASLVTGQSRNVGVVLPSVSRWFFSQVLEGIEEALSDAGYDLTLYRLSLDPERRRRVFSYFLVRKRVDAVIAIGASLSRDEVRMLHGLNKPVVGVGGPIEGIHTLSIDDRAAARFMTEHLISLGHTRIMHFGGDTDEQLDFHVQDERLAGFRIALELAGLSHPDDFRRVEYSIMGGYAGALTVLADPRSRPTAVVAGCDEIAIGVIIAARQLGIAVPAGISVAGIDGHRLAAMFGLTTLEQFPARQGERAVARILSEIADQPRSSDGARSAEAPGAGDPHPASPAPGEPDRTIMPVSLAVRASTTAPAAAAAATAVIGASRANAAETHPGHPPRRVHFSVDERAISPDSHG